MDGCRDGSESAGVFDRMEKRRAAKKSEPWRWRRCRSEVTIRHPRALVLI